MNNIEFEQILDTRHNGNHRLLVILTDLQYLFGFRLSLARELNYEVPRAEILQAISTLLFDIVKGKAWNLVINELQNLIELSRNAALTTKESFDLQQRLEMIKAAGYLVRVYTWGGIGPAGWVAEAHLDKKPPVKMLISGGKTPEEAVSALVAQLRKEEGLK